MRTFGILFYTAVLILIGLKAILLAVALSFSGTQQQCIGLIENTLFYLQTSTNARIVLGLTGFLLILISISFAQIILARFQREKTIAFTTQTGQVTVSLSAVEDLIRRMSNMLPEIKELKPNVRATKKGSIIVDLRVVLKAEPNIPEFTTRLQEIARSKIQDVLGIEEQVVIRIHIAKIISHEEKDRKRKDFDGPNQTTIPFGGFGRV